MKKVFSFILAAFMLFCCAGCSVADYIVDPATESEAVTAEPELTDDYTESTGTVVPAEPAETEETESADDLLSVLSTHMWLLNECMLETYGANLNRDVAYARVYTSQDAMMNGEAPLDVVPRSTITEITDATDATLYEVTNFSTNAEVRAYLEEYFTPALVSSLFFEEFQEFDGKLYMVYGSRGYGESLYDLDSAYIAEADEDRCTVAVNMYYFEELMGEMHLMFEKIDGRWYMTE